QVRSAEGAIGFTAGFSNGGFTRSFRMGLSLCLLLLRHLHAVQDPPMECAMARALHVQPSPPGVHEGGAVACRPPLPGEPRTRGRIQGYPYNRCRKSRFHARAKSNI